MKQSILACLVAAAALTGIAGCVTRLDRLPQSSPLPHAISIAATGDFRHAPSGYVFPVQVGAFQRAALLQYDTAGLDVSAGYNDAPSSCPVVLTIYVYPTPRMSFVGADPAVVHSIEARWLDSAYGEAKREIVEVHSDAILESEDSGIQDGVPGKKAVYSIGSAQSELFVSVVEHSWYLEYRESYPSQCAVQAHANLGAFFAAWVVGADPRKPAGSRLGGHEP